MKKVLGFFILALAMSLVAPRAGADTLIFLNPRCSISDVSGVGSTNPCLKSSTSTSTTLNYSLMNYQRVNSAPPMLIILTQKITPTLTAASQIPGWDLILSSATPNIQSISLTCKIIPVPNRQGITTYETGEGKNCAITGVYTQ